MTELRRHVLAAAVLLVLAPIIAGCAGASAGMTPSASVTTVMQGWEHYLRLDWAAQPQPRGQTIDGYIYNKHGQAMGNVQLLAQALDANGSVVGQKLAWVPGAIPPLERSYFWIPALPAAQQYRVSVWSFDILDTSSDGTFL